MTIAPAPDALLFALWGQFKAVNAEQNRLYQSLPSDGDPAIERQLDELDNRAVALQNLILELPATTTAGVAIRLRTMAEGHCGTDVGKDAAQADVIPYVTGAEAGAQIEGIVALRCAAELEWILRHRSGADRDVIDAVERGFAALRATDDIPQDATKEDEERVITACREADAAAEKMISGSRVATPAGAAAVLKHLVYCLGADSCLSETTEPLLYPERPGAMSGLLKPENSNWLRLYQLVGELDRMEPVVTLTPAGTAEAVSFFTEWRRREVALEAADNRNEVAFDASVDAHGDWRDAALAALPACPGTTAAALYIAALHADGIRVRGERFVRDWRNMGPGTVNETLIVALQSALASCPEIAAIAAGDDIDAIEEAA